MSYSEQDRVYVRHFLGFAAVFAQADPRLENSITAVQSLADGGSRPDSSTENYVKSLVYGNAAVSGAQPVLNGTAQNTVFAVPSMRGLLQIEQNIETLDAFMGALESDSGEAKLDSAREMLRLRAEGRRKVRHMARMLGMKGARIDVFAGDEAMGDDDPFAYDNSPFW